MSLAPFKIKKVNGTIPIMEYVALIKDGNIPYDKKGHHDLRLHINPAVYYVQNCDKGFMHKMKAVIDQPGTPEEKMVDYVMFELVTAYIWAELIEKREYVIGDRPVLLLAALGRNTRKDCISNIEVQRFNSNYMNLGLHAFLPKWTSALFQQTAKAA